MRASIDRQKRLAHDLLLMPDGTMLIEMLDGFFAGLVLCPVTVPIGEWLPFVLDARPEPDPVDGKEAPDALLEDLMWYLERVERRLMREPDGYVPLHAVVEPEGEGEREVIWEIWAHGFGFALNLRPKAWEAYTLSRDANAALLGLMSLAEIAARREATEMREASDLDPQIDSVAEQMTAEWVRMLAADAAESAAPLPAPGRNDPCPCGSGKKYKKCCGAA